ncbi:phenylacetic acid degradation operon negative regulatory protein PaaX [Mycoplana dimorpha]|uniref:PaaX family transcriptional regulator n=1 Tax=Mycoplana dimorpha TaxID=28320 RepID=A0A2T5BB84_MYCDI|nr:phenylacetic acid degradation operon negative regulatory protein PaaX [Mycoplana dimorpha]PTM96229.1 PaaX family transcriptional regulator [Mycoplana dimorpha]
MTTRGRTQASENTPLRQALSQVLERLQSQPSRTWSIIITFYGDALLPRGDSVWLGTLNAFFKGLDIGDGVVRTAMSRLAADGWIERNKVGRNSFYRLGQKGRETFLAAANRIYHPRPDGWDGHYTLLMPLPGADREALRKALEEAGFGTPVPGTWIAPSAWDLPEIARDEPRLWAEGSAADMRALAERAWPVAELAGHYRHFIADFAPLLAALDQGLHPSDLGAITARVLMIHEYRRIVLRDPGLPAAILPDDWPGTAARQLCAALYRQLASASERWLDQNGIDEDGPLKPPRIPIADRFV